MPAQRVPPLLSTHAQAPTFHTSQQLDQGHTVDQRARLLQNGDPSDTKSLS